MKRILLLLLLTVAFVTVNGQDTQINFEKGNFASAKAKAKQQNKFIFFDAYTNWCGPCKVMDATVFKDKKVADFMNINFISIKVNMDSRPGIVLSSNLDINAFPTLLVFDSEGKEVFRHVGTYSTSEFMSVMKSVSKGENKEFADIKAQYEGGDNSAITTAIYIDYLQKLYMSKTLKKVVADIELSLVDMLTPDNSVLFETLISDFKGEISEDILDKMKALKNKDKLSLAKKIVNEKLDTYLIHNVTSETYPTKIAAGEKYIEIAESLGFDNVDNIHYQCAKMGDLMYADNVAAAFDYAYENMLKNKLFIYPDFIHIMLCGSIFKYPFTQLGLEDTKIAYNKLSEILNIKEIADEPTYVTFLNQSLKQLSNKILYYKIDDEIKREE